MAVLVAVQAVAIALLGILVVGLLRSHAEILRTLHRLGAGLEEPGATPVDLRSPRPRLSSVRAAVDIVGASPAGEAVQIGVRHASQDTLLAFLSSGCSTCAEFWRAFAQPPATLDLPSNTRVVIVTRDPAEESRGKVRELAPAGVPVVMSSQAWKDYQPAATPFFMHVDGSSGAIAGQGTGGTWAQVSSMLAQALGDETEAGVDRKLMAAGIQPGDPSLYPSRQAEAIRPETLAGG